DVHTRWNYTHAMIQRGLMLREAIDAWTLSYKETEDLFILLNQWKLLGELADLLEVSIWLMIA
ncbi:hypothetical protein BT96DRAFT_841738, partial [Gymnopus androsaceus JB14]